MRVLVVEDDFLIASSLARELEIAGHTVLGPVSCSRDAIALAESERPQVALLDLDLEHQKAGLKVASRLQHELQIGVIYTTGRPSVGRDHACDAFGMIVKPYFPELVLQTLRVVSALMNGESPLLSSIPCGLELFAHHLRNAGTTAPLGNAAKS
jgi:two-component system, response regulator PdtaR